MKPSLLSIVLLSSLLMGIPVWAYENNPLQGLHQAMLSDMETEEPAMLPQVDLLWRSAVMRDPTLQLALTKMAEKTGDIKPRDKKNWTRKLLQGAIQFGGMGGAMATGNAFPLVGSSFLGRITASNEAPRRLTAVTSADLVLLAKAIEATQSELLLNYLRYRQAQAEVSQLETTMADMQNQSAQIAQESGNFADISNTLILNQTLQLQQAHDTVMKYRNLLVLAAGEEAVQATDNPNLTLPVQQGAQVPSDEQQPQSTRKKRQRH